MGRRGRPAHPDILTPREWEVLELLREGLNNVEMAERLGISRDGVKYHVSQILSKLNVESREEAAVWEPERAPSRSRRIIAPLLLKAAGATVVAAAVLGAAALGVVFVMDDGDSSTPKDDECESECIPTPVLLSTGVYTPDFSQDAEILGGMTLHRVYNRPPGPAAIVAGLDIYSDRDAFIEADDPCGGAVEPIQYADYYGPPPFTLDFLPPGTHERGDRIVPVCPGGAQYYYYYALAAGPSTFTVQFNPGPPVLRIEGHAERAFEGTISGRPAVIAVGDAGRRWLGMVVEGGVLSLYVEAMPLVDAIAVLEGVDCLICTELNARPSS